MHVPSLFWFQVDHDNMPKRMILTVSEGLFWVFLLCLICVLRPRFHNCLKVNIFLKYWCERLIRDIYSHGSCLSWIEWAKGYRRNICYLQSISYNLSLQVVSELHTKVCIFILNVGIHVSFLSTSHVESLLVSICWLWNIMSHYTHFTIIL